MAADEAVLNKVQKNSKINPPKKTISLADVSFIFREKIDIMYLRALRVAPVAATKVMSVVHPGSVRSRQVHLHTNSFFRDVKETVSRDLVEK